MKMSHKVLEILYPLFKIIGCVKRKISGVDNYQLRVLLYHNIEIEDFSKFEAQIKWIKKKWDFITPEEFEGVINRRLELKKDSILLTFDDGFESNYRVAKEILSKYEIKAIFFVVTNFISAIDRTEVEKIIEKIFPFAKVDASKLSNMTWDMLKELKELGHAIGGHTKNHECLSSLNQSKLKEEIDGSFSDLKKNLHTEPLHFAYTFGDVASFSSEALKESLKCYKYIHTGLRGYNTNISPLVARDAVDAKHSNWLIGSFLEGGADFMYKPSIKIIKKWLKVNINTN